MAVLICDALFKARKKFPFYYINDLHMNLFNQANNYNNKLQKKMLNDGSYKMMDLDSCILKGVNRIGVRMASIS